jgi:hypothetical protein
MDNNNIKHPLQEIIKIKDLIIKPLTIPSYQRPYKWTSESVILLLEDIFQHVFVKDKIYRIGNIILDNEKKENNIVDGQQRLTTLSILLKYLGEVNNPLLRQNYRHKISKDNIVYNARVIKNWLDTKIDEGNKESFKNKILEKCEFVLFTVFKQDEAFQLFDSQNSRGKSLEPYDLLKAFHLREMEFETEQDKENCAEKWEKSIDDKTLKPILGNHLFKIRKWCKNEWKYDFTKSDIDEFKGISLNRKQIYPYENAIRMLDGMVENAQNDKLLKNFNVGQSFPFSITMPIINGKRFFEYVDYYIQQKEYIFSNKEDKKFHNFYDFYFFYKKYCLEYYGNGRSGDSKVRNLYENILLLYVDKFGEVEFDKFFKPFYKAVYSIRCDNKSIRLETILNCDERRILQEINDCINTDKLKKHQFKTYIITKGDEDLVKGIKIIKNFINNNEQSR